MISLALFIRHDHHDAINEIQSLSLFSLFICWMFPLACFVLSAMTSENFGQFLKAETRVCSDNYCKFASVLYCIRHDSLATLFIDLSCIQLFQFIFNFHEVPAILSSAISFIWCRSVHMSERIKYILLSININ